MGRCSSVLFAFVAAACAVPQPAPPAPRPPPPSDLVVTPVGAGSAGASSEEAKRAADAAVTKLATRLEEIEAACRDRWLSPGDVCKKQELEEIATTYRAYYPPQSDPRLDEGRIDALPRIGGFDVSLPQFVARVELACESRCDTARRASVAEIKSAAVEACVAKAGRAACAPLAKMIPPNPIAAVRDVVHSCVEECEAKKRDARAEEERERRRPRTLAQSHVCFRDCVSRCTGGRVVPRLDGTYNRAPDDWCGTCEFSCRYTCAVAEPKPR